MYWHSSEAGQKAYKASWDPHQSVQDVIDGARGEAEKKRNKNVKLLGEGKLANTKKLRLVSDRRLLQQNRCRGVEHQTASLSTV